MGTRLFFVPLRCGHPFGRAGTRSEVTKFVIVESDHGSAAALKSALRRGPVDVRRIGYRKEPDGLVLLHDRSATLHERFVLDVHLERSPVLRDLRDAA